jgi:LPXTG-site transpeptidase (sortase) family protein
LLLGVLLLCWALLNQRADPPVPDGSAGLPVARQSAEVSGSTPTTEAPVVASDNVPAPPDSTPDTAPGVEVTPAPSSQQPTAEEPEVQALPASEPVAVAIPAIDVQSPLHPLGLNEDGTLAVPSGDRYDEAAWYDGSPTPGEFGPAVIEGHVTSQGSTPSVFFDLGALVVGDLVEVTRQDGSVAVFEVYATDSFPKDDFPKVAVYGNTDVPELRLITCGGDYDPQARAHEDNIVVFARLLST